MNEGSDPGFSAKITARSIEPILDPEESFECIGCVPNVVFTCGVVEWKGQYMMYYGGADSSIDVATFDKKRLKDVKMASDALRTANVS